MDEAGVMHLHLETNRAPRVEDHVGSQLQRSSLADFENPAAVRSSSVRGKVSEEPRVQEELRSHKFRER